MGEGSNRIARYIIKPGIRCTQSQQLLLLLLGGMTKEGNGITLRHRDVMGAAAGVVEWLPAEVWSVSEEKSMSVIKGRKKNRIRKGIFDYSFVAAAGDTGWRSFLPLHVLLVFISKCKCEKLIGIEVC